MPKAKNYELQYKKAENQLKEIKAQLSNAKAEIKKFKAEIKAAGSQCKASSEKKLEAIYDKGYQSALNDINIIETAYEKHMQKAAKEFDKSYSNQAKKTSKSKKANKK